MTRTAKKPKLSDVAQQLQSGLSNALSALNQIDPDALKQWLEDPDYVHIGPGDRALIERLRATLLPIAREMDKVFDTLENAGEQLGLLEPHLFRNEAAPHITLVTLVTNHVRPDRECAGGRDTEHRL